jgi:hypothetical protein
VLVDPGRSAWDPAVKRPAWDELMDRLERGVSGGFIVFDLERFTRQPKDGERRTLAGEPQNALVRDLNARGILTSHGNPWDATSWPSNMSVDFITSKPRPTLIRQLEKSYLLKLCQKSNEKRWGHGSGHEWAWSSCFSIAASSRSSFESIWPP